MSCSWATGRQAPKSANSKPLHYYPGMRVFVTGAAGPFAHALLPVLCEHPSITGVTAIDSRAPRYAHARLCTATADLADPAIFAMLAGHDAFVHLPHGAPPADAPLAGGAEAAVRAAHRLFQAAHAAGATRLLHVSTAAVYGSAVHASEQAPLRPLAGFAYAEREARLEQLLAIDFPQCARLRPHLIVGPHAHPALKRFLSLPLYPRASDPQPLFQCVHEDDLAAAILLCLENGGHGAYNLATEDSFSVRDAIRARHRLSLGLPPAAALKAYALGSRLFRLDTGPAAWLERASHTLLVNCRRAIVELRWHRKYSAHEALAATR